MKKTDKDYLTHCMKTVGIYVAVIGGFLLVIFIVALAANGWRIADPKTIEYNQCIEKNARKGDGDNKGYLIVDDEVRRKCLGLDD